MVEQPNCANQMWRSQSDFLMHLKIGFEAVLEELNCKLGYAFFLVGFHTDDLVNYTTVRVDPDGTQFPVEEMENMLDSIKGQYSPYPDDGDQTTDEWKDAVSKHRTFTWELSRGIHDVLNAETDLEQQIPFSSTPYQIGNYLVSVVMLVDRSDYLAQPTLPGAVTYKQNGLWPSFLFAVIETFLGQYAEDLVRSEQIGSLLLTRRDAKSLLRRAGATFTHTVEYAGKTQDPQDILMYGPLELYESCNVISSMHYEGTAGIGHLVVSERNHPVVNVDVELSEPVSPDDYRRLRKLLAMCDEKNWLLLAERKIYGIGSLKPGAYDKVLENLFVIRFVKHHCWELVHDDLVLMRTTYNEPRLPLSKFDQKDLETKLRAHLPGITDDEIAHIAKLSRGASHAKHGAVLIVSAEAKDETTRLGKQSFPVKPFKLEVWQLPSVTSIDGAVLLDGSGICHALGIIMDGSVSKRGDPARGSRYNSTIRYVDGHDECVVVVCSEDGMVSIEAKEPEPPPPASLQNP